MIIPFKAPGTPTDCSAGVPPAFAGAGSPRFATVSICDLGHLPHWKREAATYFVAFHLAGCLPKSVFDRVESERKAIIRTADQLRRKLCAEETKKLQRLSAIIIEYALDQRFGECLRNNYAVAEEVRATLLHFNERRYRIFAGCVMPNQVRVFFKSFPGPTLAGTIHPWKPFTPKSANQILGWTGPFRERESDHHLVRSQGELERAVRHFGQNPEKAHPRNWKWMWVCGQGAGTTAAEDAAPRS